MIYEIKAPQKICAFQYVDGKNAFVSINAEFMCMLSSGKERVSIQSSAKSSHTIHSDTFTQPSFYQTLCPRSFS